MGLANGPPLPVKVAAFAIPGVLASFVLWGLRQHPMPSAIATFAFVVSHYLLSSWFQQRYHDALARDPSTCPQLFLYSAEDKLVDCRVVEKLLNRRKERGVPVVRRKWFVGAHMALLKQFPLEYSRALNDFLQSNNELMKMI